jgi:hypothetical protein
MIDKSFASPIPKPSKLSINRMKSATRITEIGPRPLKNTYGAQSSESITKYTFEWPEQEKEATYDDFIQLLNTRALPVD